MEISVLTGLLSLISETTKSRADFAKNNCIREIFLLQATFTRDIVSIKMHGKTNISLSNEF